MNKFMNRVKDFIQSEDGPTATEYAVMLALIIIIALGAISALGTKVSTVFTNIESNLPTGN
jgi:pilus assembly protein Flp/PilA